MSEGLGRRNMMIKYYQQVLDLGKKTVQIQNFGKPNIPVKALIAEKLLLTPCLL